MISLFLISSNLSRREEVLEHDTRAKGKVRNIEKERKEKSLASAQISVFTGHQSYICIQCLKGRK